MSATASIGARHQIKVGAQLIDIAYTIVGSFDRPESLRIEHGVFHRCIRSSSTIENFNTYDAFVTQLQSELNGTALATGLTAVGQYTAATPSFAATNITLTLNN